MRTLESLKAVDLATDVEVARYIEVHKVEAVVTREGDVHVVKDTASRGRRRVIRGLLALVEQRLGSAEEREVTPIEFQRWRGQHRAKRGVEREEERRQSNRTVTYVIEQAIEAGASDVYLDIGREETTLAFRVFGYKREVDRFGVDEGRSIARSMWSMGESQWDQSAPCDCAFTQCHGERPYRVRGSSLRDVRGNSVVCRIRDPGFVPELAACGYAAGQVRHIERILAAPGGLVLITGETNSGKSTTLAALMAAAPATQKIIEVADPVEVEFPHVTHVEIDHYHQDARGRFERILAALVRQNPDTLVLGEIRDELTAQAAQNMAIQGKRVYSTLHTQSCASAIPRLRNLGVDEALLASREFVAGIVNQNLVPAVCGECGLAAHPDAAKDRAYRARFGEGVRYLNPAGCARCKGGVAGQTLVAEVYPLCLDRSGEAHARIAANDFVGLEAHMRRRWQVATKHEHAARKIREGVIDPSETERIIGEFIDEGRHEGDVVELHG